MLSVPNGGSQTTTSAHDVAAEQDAACLLPLQGEGWDGGGSTGKEVSEGNLWFPSVCSPPKGPLGPSGGRVGWGWVQKAPEGTPTDTTPASPATPVSAPPP